MTTTRHHHHQQQRVSLAGGSPPPPTATRRSGADDPQPHDRDDGPFVDTAPPPRGEGIGSSSGSPRQEELHPRLQSPQQEHPTSSGVSSINDPPRQHRALEPTNPPHSTSESPRSSSRRHGGGGAASWRPSTYQSTTRQRRGQRRGRTRRWTGTRIVVPIVLLLSQIPYVWRTNDYYQRLYDSIPTSTFVLTNQPEVATSNNDVDEPTATTARTSTNSTGSNHSQKQEQPVQSSSLEEEPRQQQQLLTTKNETATVLEAAAARLASSSMGHEGDEKEGGIVPSTMYKPQIERPLAVRYIGSSGNTYSAFRDGAERSLYVSIVTACEYDPDPYRSEHERVTVTTVSPETYTSRTSFSDVVVTVVDWSTLNRDCHVLRKVLSQCPYYDYGSSSGDATVHTKSHEDRTHFSKNEVFVYWDDTNGPLPRTCHRHDSLLGPLTNATTIHYVRRSAVEGRHWDATAQWVSNGRRHHHQDLISETTDSAHVSGWHHSGHPLREAFVDQLRVVVKPTQIPKLPRRKRPFVVSYVHQMGNVAPYSSLRELVGTTIRQLATNRSWKHSVDEVLGKRSNLTMHPITHELVPREYVKALISTQMVVVANHDEWEGHWRLFESMASGAMVLSDVMMAPPIGVQNGTNVVWYDSLASLRKLLLYYAEHGDERRRIAARGQELALGWHRSWHDVERVLFGTEPNDDVSPMAAEAPPRRSLGY